VRELESETIAGRHQRYGANSEYLREAMAAKGYALVLDDDALKDKKGHATGAEDAWAARRSASTTNFWLPYGVSCAEVGRCTDAAGVVIYQCKGELEGKAIQVATMGQVTRQHIDVLLEAMPTS